MKNCLPRFRKLSPIQGVTQKLSKIIFSVADVNQDGVINILDLNIVAQHFNETTSSPYPRYDVNQDGKVNILDIQSLARNM